MKKSTKPEKPFIPNTEQELSDYDKMNNKQSWDEIVKKRKKIHDSIEKTKQISAQLKTKKLIIGADKKNRSKTFFGLHDTLKWTWKGH